MDIFSFIHDSILIHVRKEEIFLAHRIRKINGKYYDTGTANKSFLKVATDLKK